VKPDLPPSYVNTPVAIVYAGVDDALIVTMTRILGLCWAYDCERSPALTPEQLGKLTGRSRSTLYRHLKQPREMQWSRIDQAGRKIVIHAVVTRNVDSAERQGVQMERCRILRKGTGHAELQRRGNRGRHIAQQLRLPAVESGQCGPRPHRCGKHE